MTLPAVSVRMIVAPGVAVPVITTSLLLIGLIVGVADCVRLITVASVTIVVAGTEALPAGSVAIAEIVEPVVIGVAIVQE
jgi:hypothetical protein